MNQEKYAYQLRLGGDCDAEGNFAFTVCLRHNYKDVIAERYPFTDEDDAKPAYVLAMKRTNALMDEYLCKARSPQMADLLRVLQEKRQKRTASRYTLEAQLKVFASRHNIERLIAAAIAAHGKDHVLDYLIHAVTVANQQPSQQHATPA